MNMHEVKEEDARELFAPDPPYASSPKRQRKEPKHEPQESEQPLKPRCPSQSLVTEASTGQFGAASAEHLSTVARSSAGTPVQALSQNQFVDSSAAPHSVLELFDHQQTWTPLPPAFSPYKERRRNCSREPSCQRKVRRYAM